MTVEVTPRTNGVNVEQLVGTVNAINENPDLARFQLGPRTGGLMGDIRARLSRASMERAQKMARASNPLCSRATSPLSCSAATLDRMR
jgi:hypothetical protein